MSRTTEINELHERIVTTGTDNFLRKLNKQYMRARRKSGAPSVISRLQVSSQLRGVDRTFQLAEYLHAMAKGGKYAQGNFEQGDATLAKVLYHHPAPLPPPAAASTAALSEGVVAASAIFSAAAAATVPAALTHRRATTAIKQAEALVLRQQEDDKKSTKSVPVPPRRSRSPSPPPLPELTTLELLLLGAIPVSEQSDEDLMAFIQHVSVSGEPDSAITSGVTANTPRKGLIGVAKNLVAVPAATIEARAVAIAGGDSRRASVVVDVIARTIRKLQSQVRATGQTVDELLLATDRTIPHTGMTPEQKEKATELVAELRVMRIEAQRELEKGGQINGELLAIAGSPSDGQRAARALGYGGRVRSFLQRNESTLKVVGGVVGAVAVAYVVYYVGKQLLQLGSIRQVGILPVPESVQDFSPNRLSGENFTYTYNGRPYPKPSDAPYDYGNYGHDLADNVRSQLNTWARTSEPKLRHMQDQSTNETLKIDDVFMVDTKTPWGRILVKLVFDACVGSKEGLSLLRYMTNTQDLEKFMANVAEFYRKRMLKGAPDIQEMLSRALPGTTGMTVDTKEMIDGMRWIGQSPTDADMLLFSAMAMGTGNDKYRMQAMFYDEKRPILEVFRTLY
jgi:hypothetical protein